MLWRVGVAWSVGGVGGSCGGSCGHFVNTCALRGWIALGSSCLLREGSSSVFIVIKCSQLRTVHGLVQLLQHNFKGTLLMRAEPVLRGGGERSGASSSKEASAR